MNDRRSNCIRTSSCSSIVVDLDTEEIDIISSDHNLHNISLVGGEEEEESSCCSSASELDDDNDDDDDDCSRSKNDNSSHDVSFSSSSSIIQDDEEGRRRRGGGIMIMSSRQSSSDDDEVENDENYDGFDDVINDERRIVEENDNNNEPYFPAGGLDYHVYPSSVVEPSTIAEIRLRHLQQQQDQEPSQSSGAGGADGNDSTHHLPYSLHDFTDRFQKNKPLPPRLALRAAFCIEKTVDVLKKDMFQSLFNNTSNVSNNDHDDINNNDDKIIVPSFDIDEIQIGRLVGKGSFSEVYKIKSIKPYDTFNNSSHHELEEEDEQEQVEKDNQQEEDDSNKNNSSHNLLDYDDTLQIQQYEAREDLIYRINKKQKNITASASSSNVNNIGSDPTATSSINSKRKGSGSSSSSSRKKYVIKHLRPKCLHDPHKFKDAAASLVLEAHVLTKLHHPNIIKIYGWSCGGSGSNAYKTGRHDGFFFIMERLEETLSERICKWKKQINRPSLIRTLSRGRSTLGKSIGSIVSRRPRRRFSTGGSSSCSSSNHHSGEFICDGDGDGSVQCKKRRSRSFTTMSLSSSSTTTTIPTTLRRRRSSISNDELDLFDRLKVACDIAGALEYLHNHHNILYRDLKPTNVGFDKRGVVKIFDLGFSRQLPTTKLSSLSCSHHCQQQHQHHNYQWKQHPQQGGSKTTTMMSTSSVSSSSSSENDLYDMSSRIGTYRYMAPEVARCEPYNIKADVYSFALLLYEIIALEAPYSKYNKAMHSTLVVHEGERPPINENDWPFVIQIMLEQGWSDDISVRPSMSEMKTSLQSVLVQLRPDKKMEILKVPRAATSTSRRLKNSSNNHDNAYSGVGGRRLSQTKPCRRRSPSSTQRSSFVSIGRRRSSASTQRSSFASLCTQQTFLSLISDEERNELLKEN